MKYVTHIIGGLLGLLFVASSLAFLLNLVPAGGPPEGTPAAHFMAVMMPTGYMTFVKVLELLGGILVAIPKFRNIGLLVLGPILVNILAFHGFVMRGEGLFSPMLIVLCVMALYLLWVERRRFAGLVR
jgi:putative oxidoreductase